MRSPIWLCLCLAPLACAEEPEPTLCERIPGSAYETVKSYGTGPGGGLAKLPLYFATDGIMHVSYGDYSEHAPYDCEGQIATVTRDNGAGTYEFEFDADGSHVVRRSDVEEVEYVLVNCSLSGADRPSACEWAESNEPQ